MTTENFARYVAEFGDNNLAREVDAESAKTNYEKSSFF
jgi:hypothetical protein